VLTNTLLYATTNEAVKANRHQASFKQTFWVTFCVRRWGLIDQLSIATQKF